MGKQKPGLVPVRFPKKRMVEVVEGDFEVTVPISQEDLEKALATGKFQKAVLKVILETPSGEQLIFHNVTLQE